MRTLILIATLLLSTPALAGITVHTCTDETGELALTYLDGEVSGNSNILITDDERELVPGNLREHSFWMKEFESPLGTMFTAFTYPHHIADAPTSVYSIVIPVIPTIPVAGVKYETILIVGYTGGLRPANVPQSNVRRVVNLECEAKQ